MTVAPFALLCITQLTAISRKVRTTIIPFDVDEANHATDGWEVYQALIGRSFYDLYRSVVDQSFYPPVHSIFVAISYALGGPTLAASRLPTLVNMALVLIIMVWLTMLLASEYTGRRISNWLLVTSAALTLAFAMTSEIFITNAVLAMVEMSGALLGLLLVLFSKRVVQTPCGCIRWWPLTCAAVVAVLTFLTKYSFGLFFLPGLLAGLVTATWPRRVTRSAWAAATVIAVVYLILLSGWWFATDHRRILLFFTDHPQYVPLASRANLFFLARIWFDGYSASWVFASLSILLAVVGIVRRWAQLAVRVAAWSILAGLVVLTISTTNESRHFLPLAPLVWLLAGLGLIEILHLLQRQTWGEAIRVIAVVTMVALLTIEARRLIASLPARLTTSLEGVPAHTRLYIDALSRVNLNQPILLMGDLYDQNNLLAVRWQAATLTNQSTWALYIDYFPFEQYEHSLFRTNRKPQIASTDLTFPRNHLNEVIERRYFATIIEIKDIQSHFGPRANNPEDPLCGYQVQELELDGWIVMIYDIQSGQQVDCG